MLKQEKRHLIGGLATLICKGCAMQRAMRLMSSDASKHPVRLHPGRTEQSCCLRSSPLALPGWRQVWMLINFSALLLCEACLTLCLS